MHVCLHPFVHLTSPDVLSIAATLDKTSLGFWQEKIYTTSHDWKTHITIVKEMECIVVRLHVSTFNGSGHLLTIPGYALPTIFCMSPAGLYDKEMQEVSS